MEKILAYGIMLAIIAALLWIYRRGLAPVQRSCDRFKAAFEEFYELTVCNSPSSKLLYKKGDGGAIRLLEQNEQPDDVKEALARGRQPRARELVDEMEAAVRECFDAIGTSDRYRKRYYVPISELHTIAYLFFCACNTPERIATAAELSDVEAFLYDYKRLRFELEKRVSGK